MPAPNAAIPRALLLAGLGPAQILGWGSTFYLPAVLGPPIGESLGLSQKTVFAGVTVMYLVGAVVAPRAGRVLDAHGARPVMAAGSLVAALALLVLASAQGLAQYAAAWVLIGLALPMLLGQAAYAAVAQAEPAASARRTMTLLALMTGVTSTIMWPATALLEAALGWRGTCAVFAALHVLVGLPIYLAVLARTPPAARAATHAGPPPAPLPTLRFVLLAIGLGLPNAVSSGFSLHLIALFGMLGHGAGVAITLAGLTGPAQVAARIADLAAGKRHTAMTTGLVSAAVLPLSFLPLLAGGNAIAAAVFAVLFGIANGLMTVVRAALPLELAGAAGYGTLAGRLALPANVMIAASPPLFAAVLERAGTAAATGLAAAGATVASAALVSLALLRARDARG